MLPHIPITDYLYTAVIKLTVYNTVTSNSVKYINQKYTTPSNEETLKIT